MKTGKSKIPAGAVVVNSVTGERKIMHEGNLMVFNWRCFFGLHSFGKWKDILKGQEINLILGGSRPVLTQERECNACAIKKRRNVYAH